MKILVAILAAASACLGSPSGGLRAYDRGDHQGAFRIWLADAEQGDRDSQYHLALLYRDGQGVGKNLTESLKWLRASAQAGCDAAQTELGRALDQGRVGPADPVEARAWFERSVKQGNRSAMNELGLLYYRGRGVPVDDQRAFDLFQQAAVSSKAAMFNLGLMYETGRGQPKDLIEAVVWYSLAAEKGERGAAEERDAILGTLSPEKKRAVKSRAAALKRKRMSADLRRNGRHYAYMARVFFGIASGILFLTYYYGDRHGWTWRTKPPEVQRGFLESTGGRWRRFFLWYRPWGVLGWGLHLWYFLVLGICLISGLALATMPVDEGWIAFVVTLLMALGLSHWMAFQWDHATFARRYPIRGTESE